MVGKRSRDKAPDVPLEGPPIIPLEGLMETESTAVSTHRTPETAPPQMNKTQSELRVEDDLISSFAAGAKSNKIEVVFAFDTTGSMNSYLVEVRKKLKETCTKLMTDIPHIRIGIMAFGDFCDSHSTYVVKHQDLCTDTNLLVNWVETVASTGGGDSPEAYELALREARGLSWTPGDSNKAFVIIGDASPHPPSYTTENIYWRDEVEALVKQGVKIYGVLCNNSTGPQPFYEEVAEMSGGVLLTLKHFQLITDMFKAVCYREFGAEHLETYRVEVAERGAMDEKMADLFTQLKQGSKRGTKFGERSKEGWYLKELDKITRPSYTYNKTTNKWDTFTGPTPANTNKRSTPEVPTTTSATPSSPAKKAKKDKKTPSSPKPAKAKKTPSSPKSAKKTSSSSPKSPKASAKKTKKEDSKSEEEEPKKLTKAASHIVGTGEWKRDRHGRMASLHDE